MWVRVPPCLPLKNMCKNMCKDCKRLNKELDRAYKVIRELGNSHMARIDARAWSEFFEKRKKSKHDANSIL